MKIIESGNNYRVYGNELKVTDKLPCGTYNLCFNKLMGPYLEKTTDLVIGEDKVYGEHQKKLSKVMKSYKVFDRSMGVILSGAKGIGKSLFARMLCNCGQANDMPVLIVTEYFPGFVEFLNSITQEVVVLFDEFDKNFGKSCEDETDEATPQARLLSLFDGTSNCKKLYVVTCNDFYKLSEFYINRPGRFHYHFQFNNPSTSEINEYLKDKVDSKYWPEINKVTTFAMRVPINFDILRAIAFELNEGYKFDEALKDLNILRMNEENYEIRALMSNGEIAVNDCADIDLFRDEIGLYLYGDGYSVQCIISSQSIKNDINGNLFVESGDIKKVRIDERSSSKREKLKLSALKIDNIRIKRIVSSQRYINVA